MNNVHMILLILSSSFILLLTSIFGVYILTLLPRNKGRFKYGGVYSVTSSYYHVKYVLFLSLLKIKKWRARNNDSGPLKMYDLDQRRHFKSIERLQSLKETDAIDSVYFYCTGSLVSRDNDATQSGHKVDIILRLARRSNRVNEHWIMIRKDNEPLLIHPNAPDTVVSDCSPNGWSTLTGASILCDRPNDKWTVKYNGWLKDPSMETEQVHVDFNICFTAFTNLFDSHKDTSVELAADAIARESWNREFFNDLKNFQERKQTHYEQWGGYTGYITIGRGKTFDLQNCKGYRDHSFGIRNWSQYQRYGTFFGYLENGSCFSLGSVCCRNTLSHIRHGYLITAYGDVRPVTKHNFNLWKYFLTAPPRSQLTIEFHAGGERYEMVCMETAMSNFEVDEGRTNIFERFMKFRINGLNGRGVAEYCASDAVPQHRYPLRASIDILDKECIVAERGQCLSIRNGGCRDKTLSGGKGFHLAELAKISEVYKEIVVPDGCVVTTLSFETFTEANKEVRSTIELLKETARRSCDDELKRVCGEIQYKIVSGEIPHSMKEDIMSQLHEDIGSDWSQQRLAVRSSSEDEDSLNASSAGQMDTYLGVRGKDEIFTSIKKCWASQYSFQAVFYRTRNGLPVKSKMAVVLMKMVPSETSGVLFTVNPVDRDTTRMVINSTFGLGEAIVSGKCSPDNFVIERGIQGDLTIYTKVSGRKEIRVDMEFDGGGVTESKGDAMDEYSLSDEEALKLAGIGALIQQCYGEPCDIEWALSGGEFHILQTRPITTLNTVTDEELVHEFDSSLAFDEECVTSANIGEMMPLAVTPLTLSIFASAIDTSMQDIPVQTGMNSAFACPRRFVPSFCNHLFINLHCVLLMPVKGAFFSDINMVFLALLGRVLNRPTREDILRFGGTTSLMKSIWYSVQSMRARFQGTTKTLVWEKKFNCGYKVQTKSLTSSAQMETIATQLNDYYKCWLDTIHNTSQSAIWSLVLVRMLAGKGGWTQALYSQVATLLSTCNDVYSADVPSSLQNIADAIRRDPAHQDSFMNVDVKACTAWLNGSCSVTVGNLYREFLRRHGHRCIRESEFREKSWRTDQTTLISVLKTMVALMREDDCARKKEMSVDEAIGALNVHMNPVKRALLKWVLRKARRGVGLREWGKSLSIQMCEYFKQAFYHLGDLMVAEGLLPDVDLVYFFTSDELVSILVDKDKTVSYFLSRALRRRKILDLQMHVSLPELSYGVPSEQTERTAHPIAADDIVKLSGLPVSHGRVSGPARVISSTEMTTHIEPGDILIVPYTDVGWTPYFPLLGGLVTEKGGLLSHGAVVAREYGLPCIVGCKGSTTAFKTGDLVILDASRGTVELRMPQ